MTSSTAMYGLQALAATLGFSAFIGCGGTMHELSPDDPRLGPIQNDCQSQYSATKDSVAAPLIRECVQRRVNALFAPPPEPEMTPEEKESQEKRHCNSLGKSAYILECMDRLRRRSPR